MQNNIGERALADIFPIPLTGQLEAGDDHAFQLTVQKVARAFRLATQQVSLLSVQSRPHKLCWRGRRSGWRWLQGKRVRGLVLVNPSNPLCSVLPGSELRLLLEWAASESLWVLADELYALSLLEEPSSFVSVLSLPLPDPQRTVWFWSLSKDFGFPGIRTTFAVTRNTHLLQAVRKLITFHCVPAPLHHTALSLLSDFGQLLCSSVTRFG